MNPSANPSMPATVIHRQPTQASQNSSSGVSAATQQAQALQQQQQQAQQQINPVQTQAGSLYQDHNSLAKAQYAQMQQQQQQQQQMGHHLNNASLSPNINGSMVH